MRRREFIVQSSRAALGASFSSLASPATPADSWQDNISYLEKHVPQLLAEYHTPGLSIAIIKDAKIVWRRGFGVKDAETRIAVDNSTVFEAGSISKPVFAYAVMKLCERRVIDLDTPLTKYTATKFVQEDDPRLDLITARRVLSHTTGLPNWRSKEQPLKINFVPGEKWRYSGEGYHYLQSVITGLAGRTDSTHCEAYEEGYSVCATDFGDFMIAHVLRPFAMTSSGYVWNEAIGKNLARPHDKNGLPLTYVKRSAINVARYGSAGALLSTPTDLAKFLIEVMSPKPADSYRLNAASRKEMLRPQIDLSPLDYLQDGRLLKLSWALGWMVLHLESGDVHCHGGDNEGFHSMAAMSLARKSGFVVMNNGESGYEMIEKSLMKDLLMRFV
jgi:CubicO group peptidase (beta-lactamase class C family)